MTDERRKQKRKIEPSGPFIRPLSQLSTQTNDEGIYPLSNLNGFVGPQEVGHPCCHESLRSVSYRTLKVLRSSPTRESICPITRSLCNPKQQGSSTKQSPLSEQILLVAAVNISGGEFFPRSPDVSGPPTCAATKFQRIPSDKVSASAIKVR
ncbi:hypothetical protein CDAR_411001 [Caerostris darwini]|uniref:Uncharacterized protein n=1 Tax=Caerostris darwini TaxID=1538125 RepID=A0AAV4SER2_9ARAC|nr:hypothetical protein CDAR_411001 [Caerostris darwini]